ncbi:MAG TPA: HD domain-containing phosphohydrolase [Limnochordia bacterium]|jgi:putative nucleotidyltransferase with HDIG domain|nr:HD domain-containing protein [Bacillota bacterium]HKM43055.1 HD domain-containing phosphohydrolase [Limnochordia bacterium]
MSKKLWSAGVHGNLLAGLDQATLRHSQRVQSLSLIIGDSLGLGSDELDTLSMGALLHDVGKKNIPTAILFKEAPLSVEDWVAIQQHPIHGWEFVKTNLEDKEVQEMVLHHHLWFDGQGGYPVSLKGVKPGLLTQIASVADVVDAMTQDRPYRRAMSIDAALQFLAEQAGTQFCPDVVEAVRLNLNRIIKLIGA